MTKMIDTTNCSVCRHETERDLDTSKNEMTIGVRFSRGPCVG